MMRASKSVLAITEFYVNLNINTVFRNYINTYAMQATSLYYK